MKHEQEEIRSPNRREAYKNRCDESKGIKRAARDNITTSRASRGVEKNITRNIEMKGRRQVNNQKAIRGVGKNKARNIETETSLQRAERREVLTKTK